MTAAGIRCARGRISFAAQGRVPMSRQTRKEAAAATRDLLKLDAARVRKAAAPPMRKAAWAAMRKAAAAPVRKNAAASVPEQRSPPRSFTEGSYFFNGSAGDFYSSPGLSSQPWNHQSSDPSMWGPNATPPGGFTNFIFGGEPSQYAPFRPPRTTQDVQSEEEFSTPTSAKDNSTHVHVEKMEQTKLAHLAAKEQKEARKLELESRMFETYNHLLSMDLSLMSDEEKVDHASTMKCLKKRLFASN